MFAIHGSSLMKPTRFFPILLILPSLCLLVFMASCAAKLEDTSYLTPIPQSTIAAYKEDMPIKTKQDAAIAAQALLSSTRLEYEELPRVTFVENLSLEEAHQKVRQTQPGEYFSEDRPGNTRVWLVLLEGNWRIVPPDPEHVYTPEPLTHGCAFVILDRENDRSEINWIKCSN
jgi:hypothetical protein